MFRCTGWPQAERATLLVRETACLTAADPAVLPGYGIVTGEWTPPSSPAPNKSGPAPESTSGTAKSGSPPGPAPDPGDPGGRE